MPPTSFDGSASAKPRRCACASASSYDVPSVRHGRQNEVGRAVDDPRDARDVGRKGTSAKRAEKGDARNNTRLVAQRRACPRSGVQELITVARKERLVRGDDGDAAVEGREDQAARRFHSTEQLDQRVPGGTPGA